MDILYCRVSTLDQKTDRQRVKEKDFSMVIEDHCSGAIPFFERDGGRKIRKLVEKGSIKGLSVWSLDRVGRSTRDILNTIHYFTEKGICIHFLSQGIRTIDQDGRENPMHKLLISVLSCLSELERSQIRERQLEGISIAKAKGVYRGRKANTKEDVLKFLSKKRNKVALDYLKMGVTPKDAAKLSGVHLNTCYKIRKLGLTPVNNLG